MTQKHETMYLMFGLNNVITGYSKKNPKTAVGTSTEREPFNKSKIDQTVCFQMQQLLESIKIEMVNLSNAIQNSYRC